MDLNFQESEELVEEIKELEKASDIEPSTVSKLNNLNSEQLVEVIKMLSRPITGSR